MSNKLTWNQALPIYKKRALEYLPQNPGDAIASMASDIGAHQGDGPDSQLVSVLTLSAAMGPQDEHTIRRWIEGWN